MERAAWARGAVAPGGQSRRGYIPMIWLAAVDVDDLPVMAPAPERPGRCRWHPIPREQVSA